MNVILVIDTSDNKYIKVGLIIDGKEHLLEQEVDARRAQVVLPLAERLLKEEGLQMKDIKEIKVEEGPGSFTGLRVGIAIANALGMLLKVPVNKKALGKIIEPVYK